MGRKRIHGHEKLVDKKNSKQEVQ